MITKEQALTVDYFVLIEQVSINPPLNTHFKSLKYRRNGKTKVLKRTPEFFKIPVKRGALRIRIYY
jgi:hypothetical protein